LSSAYLPPSNEIEQHLIRLLEEFLGIEGIGIYDNFFDLGMSSLDLIQLKSQAKKELFIDISVVQFYHFPTPARLGTWLIENHKNEGKTHVNLGI
jgi:acyl carrier protein